MVFPGSYTSFLLVAVLSLIFLGLWAVTVRMTGRWRWELYALDFATGVFLCALLTGFTLGVMGQEITFFDNLNICRKSSVGFLFAFGGVLALGTLLLVGAVSLAGMTMTYLMGFGIAAAVTILGSHMVTPQVSGVWAAGAAVLLLAGAGLIAPAHAARLRQRDLELLQRAIAAGAKTKPPRSSPWKGIILCMAGGLLTGLVAPMVAWAQGRDEITYGAYSIGFMFAISFLVFIPFFNLFFLNLPIQGEPLSLGAWGSGSKRVHLLGIAGGMVFYAGILAYFLATGAPALSGFRLPLAISIGRASVALGALAGIFYAGDFPGALQPLRGRAMLAVLLGLAGLAVFALAPAA